MKQRLLFDDMPEAMALLISKVERIEEILNKDSTPAATKPNVLTIRQAAEYLSVSESYLYHKVGSNEVPYMRLKGSNRVRFDRSQLDKWIQAGQRVAA